jgi:predicted RNase H-like HicB family nuclease
VKYVLTDYLQKTMRRADYEKLKDGTYAGRIPKCTGVVAFAPTLKQCEEELQSVLEDWVLLGLKGKHHLPKTGDIDLNKVTFHAEVASR